MDPDARQRALASEARLRILRRLEERGDATARELAEDLSRHENTIREHLGTLENAGLVSARETPTGRRGRPSRRYQPRTEHDPHTGLARALAAQISHRPEAAREQGREAGRPWGERLVLERESGPRAEPLREVVAVLDELGFAPTLREDAIGTCIEMRGCPFGELAREQTDVVCGAHRGLLEGALAAAGAGWDGIDLAPFATSAACVARLEPSG
ncbi:helix-turn-helix transcriptional regulator [Egibacter rhizosphaerae]|uniref:helix-turn-helix transcriptional regulator n=1 Tax=Egibacter rhizosphaerae TaxID=1670831 RepID=UPI0013F175E7|nr:helix-turn-helix domain-containing protein [Egibacter rhizosphaerae]